MQTIPRTLLALAIFAPWVCGQTALAPESPSAAIATRPSGVSLDLVVRDKKNKPVLNLKPADIAITDNGSRVEITDLHLAEQGPGSDRFMTFLFDRLDTSASRNARDIAAKILKSAPPLVHIEVAGIDGRLRLFEPFTNDRAALATAIAAVASGGKFDSGNASAVAEKTLIAAAQSGQTPSGTAINAQDRSVAQLTLASLQESQKIVQDQHAQPSLASLLALARTQGGLPGRKVVVYFAAGLQLDSDGRSLLHAIVGEANGANVSIYAVDANALDMQTSQELMATVAMGGVATATHLNPAPTGIATLPTGAAGPGATIQASDQVGRFESSSLTGGINPLVSLAASTGGTYIGASDSLRKPLQGLLDDLTNYYQASFLPSNQNYDGSFHSITVKAIRPGLLMRSSSGYYARPPGNSVGIRPFEAPLLKILEKADLPTDLKFRSTVLRLGDLPSGSANELVVEIPLPELEIHEDTNTNLYSLHLSIVAQIKNHAGTVIEHFSEEIPRHGALEALAAAQSEVVTLQRHFIAGPGQYVMEAAILDRNSGKTAAQRFDFTIAPAPPSQSISDMALVRRTEPSQVDGDPLDPLQYEKTRVVPDISGQVTPGAKDVALFFILHPDIKASSSPRLELEVRQNGSSLARVPLPLRRSVGTEAVPYMATIKANSLSAGRYEVVATLTQGETTVQQTVPFTIGEPSLARMASGAGPLPSVATQPASDGSPAVPGIGSRDPVRLNIASVPNVTQAPAEEEAREIVEAARERALSYTLALPNFTCVEITNRSVDHSGDGRWKQKDVMAEKLTYHDRAESRVMLEVNGQRSSKAGTDLKGAISHGEFGGLLNAVFQPSSKADFHWKETDTLGSGIVQAFAYSVALENTTFRLTGDNNWQIGVGFHGLVYIDASTRSIRRITLVADNLPRDFSIRSTSISMDYDYIAINSHDYLMPIRGTVSLTQGKRQAILNEVQFRDYKRFGSTTKILGFSPAPDSATR